MGFDTLFQFTPFQFIADIGAGVAVRAGGQLLMSVYLELTLTGPTPWHLRGAATFQVFGVPATIQVDHRFGPAEPPPLPEPVDVLALLIEALRDTRNWSSELPRDEHPLVSLREARQTGAVMVHPLAVLTVRQRVVPLNRPIAKIGNTTPSGDREFRILVVTASGSPFTEQPTVTKDRFARAQFFELSDDEKLSASSFEEMDSGLQFGLDTVVYGPSTLDSSIEYETAYLDPQMGVAYAQELERHPVAAPVFDALVELGAAGEAAIRRTGSARYRPAGRATSAHRDR